MMRKVFAMSYLETWTRSQSEPQQFWMDAAKGVTWAQPPTQSLEESDSSWSWFKTGSLNMCVNAVDRHVDEGRGQVDALHYHSTMTNTQRSYTYRELRDRVASFAGALVNLGVNTGDRVLIYMPMIPEAVIAMLACSRIGAVHVVVFGGFSATELRVRIDDVAPRVILTASGGFEPGRIVEYLPAIEQAVTSATLSVEHIVVLEREGIAANKASVDQLTSLSSVHDWNVIADAADPAAPVAVPSTHPLYILHTSGTTGTPKGVVRDTGGYAVALAWTMRNIYNIGVADTMFTASDIGWVVGHSFIVYGPLIAGGTTLLYEGKPVGTPDPGVFWRIAQQYGVKTMFTAPTALRSIRRVDPNLQYLNGVDLSQLETLFLAGERLDPETLHWAERSLGVPVVDHWWQTETGWPICAIPIGIEKLEARPGSSAVPMPGYDVRILDSQGRDVTSTGEEGNIALRLPLPPGTLTGIWGNPERLRQSYLDAFPGWYATGDGGYVDADGYVFIMGRTDDVINVAGHRLSTGVLEEALARHPAVAECAVIGIADELKGQRAAGFVTLKAGEDIDPAQLRDDLIALVRQHIGPVAAFRDVTVVDRLPKTRSGKILRKTMRAIVDGQDYTMPATIEDPSVLDDIARAVGVGQTL